MGRVSEHTQYYKGVRGGHTCLSLGRAKRRARRRKKVVVSGLEKRCTSFSLNFTDSLGVILFLYNVGCRPRKALNEDEFTDGSSFCTWLAVCRPRKPLNED